MTRQQFTQLALLSFPAFALPNWAVATATDAFVSQRPATGKRKFTSKAVDALIEEIKAKASDKELAWMFENCFPNTLDTTVFFETTNQLPDTYVITGDIDAMWLRDSSAQVNPYLSLCPQDPQLSLMVEGLIRRQTRNILLDPYANAFYKDDKKISQWKNDKTDMKPGVHERKWEVDSLCYCIRLAYQYWKITGNTVMLDAEWNKAMALVVATMQQQQRKKDNGPYRFERKGGGKNDTLQGQGYGMPFKPTGMICSAFRNSDDACTYLFNIPENLFAVTALGQLAEMLEAIKQQPDLVVTCKLLAKEIEQGVNQYGIADHPKFGKIYAYECDGLGNQLLMEDAGLPGLVTIPYLGYGSTADAIYQRSRKFALSESNPYFFKSKVAEGTGSPHLDWKGDMIWHLGIIARAITAIEDEEIKYCLNLLKASHAGKGFMHEGFRKNNPNDFTRHWFAWANSFFGELIVKLYRERPHLL